LRPDHQIIADKAVQRFAERIRELRAERGWSQERLAEEADLHRTYIGGIERSLRNVSLFNIASSPMRSASRSPSCSPRRGSLEMSCRSKAWPGGLARPGDMTEAPDPQPTVGHIA
jgi:DNA-binding XRE family transcriptional regulator